MRHLNYILIVTLSALISIAACAAPVDVKQYVALRKSLASGIGLDAVKSNPAAYSGKVFEIRGRLAGVIRRGEAGSLMLATDKYGSFVVDATPLPNDSPGVEIACLADVSKTGELSVRAWTYEAELKRYEESLRATAAPAPKPPTKQAQTAPPQTKAAAKPAPAVVSMDSMVKAYKNAIKQFNGKLTDSQADTIARSILAFSSKYKVDARLVCAVIIAESNFRVGATSRAGAMGLGQLMPTTAAGLGVNNAYDPVENIYGSTRYIKGVLDRVSGNKQWNDLTWNDLALGLAAYNAGPGAVRKHGGIPPYRETQNYVHKVTSIYKRLCGVG